MSDKPLFDPEKLSIIEFKLINGQVDTPEEFITEKVERYELENSLQLAFNLEEKLVKVDYRIDILSDSKGGNAKEASARFHFVYIYKVENLKELAVSDDASLIDLDQHLANALSSITYSTSRGVLLTRLQGTAFQNFILPVINPNKLLPNK